MLDPRCPACGADQSRRRFLRLGVALLDLGSCVGENTRTVGKCPRRRIRSSKSTVYTRSPLSAAEAMTMASTTCASLTSPSASPAAFAMTAVIGSTSTIDRISARSEPRHHSARTAAGTGTLVLSARHASRRLVIQRSRRSRPMRAPVSSVTPAAIRAERQPFRLQSHDPRRGHASNRPRAPLSVEWWPSNAPRSCPCRLSFSWCEPWHARPRVERLGRMQKPSTTSVRCAMASARAPPRLTPARRPQRVPREGRTQWLPRPQTITNGNCEVAAVISR